MHPLPSAVRAVTWGNAERRERVQVEHTPNHPRPCMYAYHVVVSYAKYPCTYQ